MWLWSKKIPPPTDNADKVPNSETTDFDFNSKPKHSGPITQAIKKLLDHKNATQLAMNGSVRFIQTTVGHVWMGTTMHRKSIIV